MTFSDVEKLASDVALRVAEELDVKASGIACWGDRYIMMCIRIKAKNRVHGCLVKPSNRSIRSVANQVVAKFRPWLEAVT